MKCEENVACVEEVTNIYIQENLLERPKRRRDVEMKRIMDK
jgi:hypothetical protein